jgi:hypothetical protein
MRKGGCQCGQVRFEFTGEPINEVFCYCTDCQTRTGSDKWFGIWIPTENFNFVGEKEPQPYTTQDSSGNDIHCYTCPNCGVSLSVEFTSAGFHTVAASNIEGNNEFKPKLAIFASSAPNWAILPSDIPIFDRLPPEMGG